MEWSSHNLGVDIMSLGQRIKQIRLERGETTSEFAKHLTASKGTVSKWENGKYEPNRKRLKKIAELGDTTVKELLYGSTDNQSTIIHLSNTIDRLLREKHSLQAKLDSTTELIDWYVEHYTEKGYKDTTARFKDLQKDVERTIR